MGGKSRKGSKRGKGEGETERGRRKKGGRGRERRDEKPQSLLPGAHGSAFIAKLASAVL